MPREDKIEMVEELTEQVKSADALILTDYRGLDVKQITALRKKLREAGAEYRVVKNTLLKRAASDISGPELDRLLEGPTAVAFVHGDPVAIARAVSDYIREHKMPALKGGYVEGSLLDAVRVEQLSKIPPKQVLYAQLLGSMQSPITGLVGTLQAMVSNLVYTLQAVADKKAA